MFIDIHCHVGLMPIPVLKGKQVLSSSGQMLKFYKKNEIEKGVILPVVNCGYLGTSQSMAEILLICKKHPGKFTSFMNIDPKADWYTPTTDLGELMRFHKDRGMKGIGEIMTNLHFLDPFIQNLFKYAEEGKLPVLFHISPQLGVPGNYGIYDEAGLPFLERCLQIFPKLTFIGHSQAFWAEMSTGGTSGDRYGYPKGKIQKEGAVPKLLRKYGNLHADLSAGSGFNALSRDVDYAVEFINEFQDRLYFGADICCPDGISELPLCGLLKGLKADGRISADVFNKVAKGNAKKLLKI